MLKNKWEQQQQEALEQAIDYAGDVKTLAKLLNLSTSAIVHGWVKRGRISKRYANELHFITKGKISREYLRPDVQDWSNFS